MVAICYLFTELKLDNRDTLNKSTSTNELSKLLDSFTRQHMLKRVNFFKVWGSVNKTKKTTQTHLRAWTNWPSLSEPSIGWINPMGF